ncbi:MAG: putative peptide modification system cyclase [Pseudomonadota bacterium]
MTSASQTPQVRTLLLTDMVDSTGLVERLGDNAAADLFRAHDRAVMELQQRWRGRLIDRSDGLLLIFERPIDALGFALDYVRGLRELGRERNLKHPLQARAGLHVGEVLVWENSVEAVRHGAKSMEVEGLAKPLAGRLMALARPGQILLSATAEPLAHRAARELGERGELLVWKPYGRWRFKGLPEAQEVFEVGEPGLAPLRMPAHTPKAWRDLPLWRRPAALAVETLLLAGIVIGGWFLTKPQPAIAFAERDWVVVGDVRNLTGDARLDDALEQAFRISLEQSPYVNLLSDLKVRDTLQRMQRKPDAPVDRTLGSEIALRDGVRALILPTVAEVGGRLRVSAEVVDPRTQTTVYAVSADGRGLESVLGSIDEVSDQLRNKLGEAMESVQKNSVPLPNVSTTNLDALKAYAVARKLSQEGRDDESMQSLKSALALDPDFASAHAAQGYVSSMLGHRDAARASLDRAAALQQRMTSRERLQLQANRAMLFESPGAGYRAWKALSDIYPDHGTATYMLAQLTLLEQRDYARGLALARDSARPQSTAIGLALYLQGIAQLGLGKWVEAERAFAAAVQAGVSDVTARAAVMAGQRQWQAADALLVKGFDALSPNQKRERLTMRALVALDSGDAAAAMEMMEQAQALGGDDPAARVLLGQQQLVLAHAAGGDATATARGLRDIAPTQGMDAGERHAVQLARAWLAADIRDTQLLDRLLREFQPQRDVIMRDWPTQALVLDVLQARRQTLAGEGAAALQSLQSQLRRTDTHSAVLIAALEAARASGNETQAAGMQARLGNAVGRAYADGIGGDTGELLRATWIGSVRDAQRRGAK